MAWRGRVPVMQAENISGLDSAEFDVLLDPFLTNPSLINRSHDDEILSCASYVWYIEKPSDLRRDSLWSATPGQQHLVLDRSFKISSSRELQVALRELLTTRICTLALSLEDHGEAISRILLHLPESSALRHLRIQLDLARDVDGSSLMAALTGSPWKVRGVVFESARYDQSSSLIWIGVDELAQLWLQQVAESLLQLPFLLCVGFMWFDRLLEINVRFLAHFFKTLGKVLTSPHHNITALSLYNTRLPPSALEALFSIPHKLTRLDLRSYPPPPYKTPPSISSAIGVPSTHPDQQSSIRDLGIYMDFEIVQEFGLASIMHVSANVQALRLSVARDTCSSTLTMLQQYEVLLKLPQLQMLEFQLPHDFSNQLARDISVKLSSLCRSVLLGRPATNAIHSLKIVWFQAKLALAAEIVRAAADQGARLQMSRRSPTDGLQSAPSSCLLELQFVGTAGKPNQEDEMALAQALSKTMICSFSYPWISRPARAMAVSNLKKNRYKLGLLEQPQGAFVHSLRRAFCRS